MQILQAYLKGPLPLSPDLFTPRARTPWGGTYIAEHIKEALCPDQVGEAIGESWDFSCEPSFPSTILGTSVALSDLIKRYPEQMLSRNYVETKPQAVCEILVKILNAADDLSLQVHPHDDDSYLEIDECGKYESWYVLHAEKGAGLYLGFQEGVRKTAFEEALRMGKDLRSFLQFVPVQAGDYFEIPQATCHAVGKGLVLIEPQRVLYPKKGKTYRIYDWGRRYDAEGRLDPKGKPRDLHIEASLRLLDPERQCGSTYIKQLRRSSTAQTLGEGVVVQSYGSNPYYGCHRVSLRKGEKLVMNIEDGFAALLSLQGCYALRPEGGIVSYWQKGQPGFLPANCFPLNVEALEDTALFLVCPSSAKETWKR
jgi:mannose-6-phosphate isomerase